MSTLFERANTQWKDVDRDALKKDAGELGVELKGNWSDETARARLCAQIGQLAPASESKTSYVTKPRPTVKPNLTTIGSWGGRCRDVSVFRPQNDNSPGCPVQWDAMRIYIPYDDGTGSRYTIPEPHFESLKNAKTRTFDLRCEINKKGDIDYSDTKTTEAQTFPFQGGEITPGTEHLPGSLLEWYQWEAKDKDYFKAFKKSRLEDIWSELSGQRAGEIVPGGGYKEWDREKVRTEVLRFLGTEYFAQLDQDEYDPALQEKAA